MLIATRLSIIMLLAHDELGKDKTMDSMAERYADNILGTISCFDRIVIGGTWPEICHARVLATLLKEQGVRLFDYPRWAEPYRELIMENAERLARENGLKIDFIRQRGFRMADQIKEA